MNKSSKPFEAQDGDDERRRKLQFKKRKQRGKEPRINLKNVRSITGKIVGMYKLKHQTNILYNY